MKQIKLFCLIAVLMFIAPGCEKKPTKPLDQAAAGGDIAQVKLHIARGADVNAKDEYGVTPLHWAATHGHRDVAELLIAKGADVNAKDARGRSPLWNARDRGFDEIVELLRKPGATE